MNVGISMSLRSCPLPSILSCKDDGLDIGVTLREMSGLMTARGGGATVRPLRGSWMTGVPCAGVGDVRDSRAMCGSFCAFAAMFCGDLSKPVAITVTLHSPCI